MATYEEIMAKSRELYAAGDTEGAKRLAQIAVSRKGQDQPADIKPNPDGTYGQPPEGFILDPNTGAMTSQELQANRTRPNVMQAARVGSEEGVMWGGRDEATGALAAATPGLPGTAKEQYDMAQLRARAELEAARRDHPLATIGGEIAGSAVTGGTAARALGGLAPRAAGNLAGRNFATRALTGGAATAPGAALYGFNAGEGGDRLGDAKSAGLWGFGLGAGMSVAGDGAQAYLANRAGRRAEDAMVASTPSTEELLRRGGQMIEDARATGRTAGPDDTKALAQDMRSMLLEEGVIGPRNGLSGNAPRVEAYPKVGNVLERADDYFGQSMTPAQMGIVRKAAQRAARSTDPEEARLGSKLISQFDEWEKGFLPEIAEGRSVYAKGKRGEEIDTLMELAGSGQAARFSGSGYENALRRRFSSLNDDIIKGKRPDIDKETAAAIARVANGDAKTNTLRNIGKAAPTGVVSLGIGGGMPFMIGNALGGPAVGAAASAGTMGAGAMARAAATRAQSRNANIAAAMARGGKVAQRTPQQLLEEQNKRAIIEQLLRYGGVPVVSQ